MRNLFIIGNGFDLDHGLKTSYENFHEYLNKNYPDAPDYYPVTPNSCINPKGDVSYIDREVVGFLKYIISEAEADGDNWGDLENSLGLLNFDIFLDSWADEEDDNEWHEVYRNQDIASNLAGAVYKLNDYFEEWVNTITLDDISTINNFENLIDKENDIFLTFNYTRTLEELYKVKTVCHIHGKQGEDLIFGHGNHNDCYDYYQSHHIGSEDAMQAIHRDLRKEIKEAFENNKDFFRDYVPLIDKIYTYGFSFSKVDEFYIKEICKRLSGKDITWYLNDYHPIDKLEEFKNIIISCGFKGKFNSFHIS